MRLLIINCCVVLALVLPGNAVAECSLALLGAEGGMLESSSALRAITVALNAICPGEEWGLCLSVSTRSGVAPQLSSSLWIDDASALVLSGASTLTTACAATTDPDLIIWRDDVLARAAVLQAKLRALDTIRLGLP